METMEQNIQLIYVSEATVAFEREDLHELLTKARRNNAALGITGVLLYVEGFFLQVLEGKENAVLQLYEKISQDSRHTRVSKIITELIAERGFAEWEMGYANVGRADLAQIEGLKDFFGGGSSLDALGAGRATTVVTAFREGRWRRQIGA